jgi:molecular chaperone HscB
MTAAASCWSCGGTTDGLFCAQCNALQPPQPVDLFARLGVTAAFDLDGSLLERRYFELQRKLHPDKFASRGAKEREYSLQHTANLNEAHKVLRSPLLRAEYLLRHRGHRMPDGEHTVADPEILMHAMEMREALAEAATRAEVDAVAAEARAEANDVVQQLGAAFAVNELSVAERLALRLRYLEKFSDEARDKRVRASA